MSSPHESYLENRAEERQARQEKVRARRLEIMYQLLHGPGFGEFDGDDGEWVDKEIYQSLRRAFELLLLSDRGSY